MGIAKKIQVKFNFVPIFNDNSYAYMCVIIYLFIFSI